MRSTVSEWTRDASRWDQYCRRHPRATALHTIAWRRALEHGFGHRPRYLWAERGGQVVGVLPLFSCRAIDGRVLVSLPHSIYGGPLADDLEAEQALLAEAGRLGRSEGAVRLELRNRRPPWSTHPLDAGFVTFERGLPETPDAVVARLPRKTRHVLGGATARHGLVLDRRADVAVLHALVASTFRRLGTPVFPRRFFEGVVEAFGADASLLLVRRQGLPVGAGLGLSFGETFLYLYGGAVPGAAAWGVDTLKAVAMMQLAVERGLRRFDFGRTHTSNLGVLAFKRHHGFEPEPLPYQRIELTTGAGEPPDPHGPLWRSARRVWSRLPARITDGLGPHLCRLFP